MSKPAMTSSSVSFGVSTMNSSASFAAPNIVDAKKKKTRVIPPSIRLELTIEPPDSEKFTEFNYNKLILKTFKCFKKQSRKDSKKEKKEGATALASECLIRKSDLSILESQACIKKACINEFLSMYHKKIILSKELDDDERINGNPGDEANKMDDDHQDEDNSRSCDLDDEQSNPLLKSGPARKKSTRNTYESDNNKYKLRDFAYLGKGYDENDSFIDNSDAHDVHVPSNMAPKRGGFYINKEQIKLEKIKDKKGKRSGKWLLLFYSHNLQLFFFFLEINLLDVLNKYRETPFLVSGEMKKCNFHWIL